MIIGGSGYGSGSGYGGGDAASAQPVGFYENRLRGYMTDPSSFASDPGFKFALDTGRQAVERSAAARGMGNSGNVLAELMKYGTGLAFQQRGQELDRLGGLAAHQDSMGLANNSANQSALNNWLQYGLNKDRLSLDQSNSQNQYNLGMYNANTSRGAAKSRDWWNLAGA